MNQMIAMNFELTMSSREIAELCDKEHRNVMRDIRYMLTELYGEGGVLKFEHTQQNPQNGQSYPVYLLPKRETLILVSGYSIELRARIIDRWQELEAQTAPIHHIPQTLPEALRLAADESERADRAEAELALAAPKAQALDRVSASEGTLTITQAAKVLGVKRGKLTSRLAANGWIYRQNGSWVAYQQHIQNGRLIYKEAKYTDDNTGQEVYKPYCHITQKGLAKLAQDLQGDAA